MSLSNFYQALPSKYHIERTTYPNYDRMRIDIPCMMCVIGSTGSGKTNAVLNIIQHINCWTKIYLFAKNLEEPLYAFLIDKLKAASRKLREPIIVAENDIDKLPAVSDIDKAQTNLLIVDDMITEKSKQLQRVAEYWIRGRKQNCTCIFISQSYYDIPLLIRKNTQYFAFLKINTLGDLKRIVKEYSLGVTPKDMLDMYRTCTAGHMQSFFLIDVVTNDPRYRFRKNFTPLTSTERFGGDPDELMQPTAMKRRRKIEVDEEAAEDDDDDDGVPIVSHSEFIEHARRYAAPFPPSKRRS